MMIQEGNNVYVAGVRGILTMPRLGLRVFQSRIIISFSNRNKCDYPRLTHQLGRLLPQIVYYFLPTLICVIGGSIKPGDKINIVVPTGILATFWPLIMPGQMGLPVGKDV